MSNTRAALIKDLIKYILYERQQMPMPYESVKQELQQMENNIDNQVSEIYLSSRKNVSFFIGIFNK